MFASCDKLESHPHYYTREQIPVTMVTQDDGRQLNPWIYFLKDFKPELLNRECIDDYDTNGDHGLHFIRGPQRPREFLDNPKLAWSEVKIIQEEEDSKHHVFVYGTLKTGQPNHHVMSTGDGEARLLGRARSVDNYPMIIANSFNTPYVLYERGKGKVIIFEPYFYNLVVIKLVKPK